MRAWVRLVTDTGESAGLGPGEIIGRLRSAALCISDARVSEAHAMVSLRGRELMLLALRGRLAVEGKQLSKVALREGLHVQLAPDFGVRVDELVLPEAVTAIEGEGLPRQQLTTVASLFVRPRPRLVSRYDGLAAAWLWSTGEAWTLRVAGEQARELDEGEAFVVEGREFRTVAVELGRAGMSSTRVRGGLGAPLTIEAHYDTVSILREGEAVEVIGGVGARLLSELVALDGPAHWSLVARELWPKAEDDIALRKRWDVTMLRLRRRLVAVGLRSDLVSGDGHGQVSLRLGPGDKVIDRG